MTDNRNPNDWLNDPQDDPNRDDFMPDWNLFDDDPSVPPTRATSEDLDLDDLFAELSSLDAEGRDPDSPAVATDEIPAWLQASAPQEVTPPPLTDFDGFAALDLDAPARSAPPTASSSGEGIPPWLDTQEIAIAPVGNKDDVPPWLAEADETSERVIAENDAAAEAFDTRGDAQSVLPPWLQDADDLGAEEANAYDASVFDALDFGVDESSQVFSAPAAPAPSSALPEWMQTQQAPALSPEEEALMQLLGENSLPGESTDPLLAELLQGEGGAAMPDLDLLNVLEQVDDPSQVRTGMLSTPAAPAAAEDDIPDFEALFAQQPTLEAEPDPDLGALFARDDVREDTHDFDALFEQQAAVGAVPEAEPPVDLAALFDETRDRFTVEPAEETAPPPPYTSSLISPEPPRRTAMSAPAPKPAPSDDYDSFLESLRAEDSGVLPPPPAEPLDLSSLLSDAAKAEDPTAPRSDAPPLPEFLRDVSVSDASAAALLRGQQDVPLEDLPEELRFLRDELAAVTPAAAVAVVPALVQPPAQSAAPRTVVGLTDAQRRSADVLRGLSVVNGLSGDEARTRGQATTQRRQRGLLRLNIGRVLVAVLLIAAVVAPRWVDVAGLGLGTPPPAAFAPDSAGGLAYDLIDAAPPNTLVLISVDYSAGAIGELDAVTVPLLRQAFAQRLRPVLIGSDPVTLQHVGRLADEAATWRQRNRHYVVGRYVLGEAVGTQAFIQNLPELLRTDIDGLPTNLRVSGLDEFSAIVVLTDRSDSVRVWAEQVLPLTRVPLAFGLTVGAEPLARPYIAGAGGRAWVGLRDGLTYAAQLDDGALIPADSALRWSGVTLGAVVAAILIALGSLLGIMQIVLRRRR
ncbi:MAG: hypothetical protein MUC99_02985 [Anaerolineae bacterium]|nr:hypothetical protein [Anaerolineae bacterium]